MGITIKPEWDDAGDSQPPDELEAPDSTPDTWPPAELSAPELAASTEADLRAEVVATMAALIGVAGRSSDCDRIFKDAAPVYDAAGASQSGKHWCGITVLHVLRGCSLTDAEWRDGSGFLANVLGWSAITTNPKPGDVYYDDRPSKHHALVGGEIYEDEQGRKRVPTIDANAGPSPGVVKRDPDGKPLVRKRLFYFSIGKLVAAKLARLTGGS